MIGGYRKYAHHTAFGNANSNVWRVRITGYMNLNASTTLIVFGATGDLNRRKLLPSLYDLYAKGLLPKGIRIIGVSRRELSDQEYRDFVRAALEESGENRKECEEFCTRLHYEAGLFDDSELYRRLEKRLDELDGSVENCNNVLLYLATPPQYYETIFDQLAGSGFSKQCGKDGEDGWVRILLEKPFGRDLETAKELDRRLAKIFKEEQIFRIDHYLTKGALENILAFRFSNLIFDPLWSREYVDRVHIRLLESIDVGTRGSFYEGVGALRDVAENHALQMLALIAMDNPGSYDAGAIREKRAATLKALRPISGRDIAEHTVKGQYEGYRVTKDVAPDSKTATYFSLRAHIDSERWEGVPFILEGGKALAEHLTDITVYFKETPTCVCDEADSHSPHVNAVRFAIAPEQTITMTFWAKRPGFGMNVEAKHFTFSYDTDDRKAPDAYEKLIVDAIKGDQTSFTSSSEVQAAWRFITPILEVWEGEEPVIYPRGSSGPAPKAV